MVLFNSWKKLFQLSHGKKLSRYSVYKTINVLFFMCNELISLLFLFSAICRWFDVVSVKLINFSKVKQVFTLIKYKFRNRFENTFLETNDQWYKWFLCGLTFFLIFIFFIFCIVKCGKWIIVTLPGSNEY